MNELNNYLPSMAYRAPRLGMLIAIVKILIVIAKRVIAMVNRLIAMAKILIITVGGYLLAGVICCLLTVQVHKRVIPQIISPRFAIFPHF